MIMKTHGSNLSDHYLYDQNLSFLVKFIVIVVNTQDKTNFLRAKLYLRAHLGDFN